MMDISPFQRTHHLIGEIDEFLDKVSEALMMLEQTVLHYVDHGADDYLEDKVGQIRTVKKRGDELRRSVANAMYTQMLLPDARRDVLTLLNELDNVLDHASHLVVKFAIVKPSLPESTREQCKSIMVEVAKATDAMVCAARAYFREPNAIQGHTHKIGFHQNEATEMAISLGRQIFAADLPLDRKEHLIGWLAELQKIAALADNAGAQITVFGIKRAL